jgi:hypothetical protein
MEVARMAFQILDPSRCPDWDEMLLRSGDHAFFHTAGWARVLAASYGFKPLYFVRQEGERFSQIMPMMEVSSPLKGKRGIALPFTDRCAPHAEDPDESSAAVRSAIEYGKRSKWRSIEWRDDRYGPEGAPVWEFHLMHEIGLGKTEAELFGDLSSNNRRNIRKALREGVTVRIDRSADSVRSFYRLNCLTRKRHGLPPQPFIFFKNVFEHILSRGLGLVVSASYGGKVIAASVFFHFGTEALFKYGASEMEHQGLRPNNLILWEALRWYNAGGFKSLNLGRTEPENPGLLRYKRAWGGTESPLSYFRYDIGAGTYQIKRRRARDRYLPLFARTPPVVLRLLGRLFYKYFG